MKIETGVMIMKNGKAWGTVYSDGKSTAYGWVEPENAPIHDPKYFKRPEDVTWRGSPDVAELRTAELIEVERRTEVALIKRVTPERNATGAQTNAGKGSARDLTYKLIFRSKQI